MTETTGQAEADKIFAEAVAAMASAYGPAFRVSTHWAVAFGEDPDAPGAYLLQYDDEEDARDHAALTETGLVAKRTVISLPWETVSTREPRDG